MSPVTYKWHYIYYIYFIFFFILRF
jgi:hypothetical protein